MEQLSELIRTAQAAQRAAKRLRTGPVTEAVLATKSYVAAQLLRAGQELDRQVKLAKNARHGARWTPEEDALLLSSLKRTETRDPRHRLLGSVPGRTDKAISEHVASVLLARKRDFKLGDEDLLREFSLTAEQLQKIVDTGNEGNAAGGPAPLTAPPPPALEAAA